MADQQTLPGQRRPLLEWQVLEREPHHRTLIWYLVAGVLGVGLLVYSVIISNFLFAIMILLISFILIIQEFVPAKVLTVTLTYTGLSIGSSYYPWSDFKSFYLAYQPPLVEKLYFEFEEPKQDLFVGINGQDPMKIRDVMLKLLAENLEKQEETNTDVIRRILKV